METDPQAVVRTFEHQLSLMAKQIRMLSELADAAPVVQRKEELAELQEKAEFVLVCRQRMDEIVKQLKLEVDVMRYGIETRFVLGPTIEPLV